MTKAWLEQLEGWHDFYVIVGSAAAGLTGLMFVVVSLGPKSFQGAARPACAGSSRRPLFFSPRCLS